MGEKSLAFLQACARGDEADEVFEKTRNFVEANTLVKLSSAALVEIRTGVVQAVQEIALPCIVGSTTIEDEAFPDFVKKLHQCVLEQSEDEWWRTDAQSIDTEFLGKMSNVFLSVAGEYASMLSQLPPPPLTSPSCRGQSEQIDAHDSVNGGFSPALWADLPEELRNELSLDKEAVQGYSEVIAAVAYDEKTLEELISVSTVHPEKVVADDGASEVALVLCCDMSGSGTPSANAKCEL